MNEDRRDVIWTGVGVVWFLVCVICMAVWVTGCASAPTRTDAAALMALELASVQVPEVVVTLDTETTEIFADSARSGRLGSCRRLPNGQREVTIYVARHGNLGQLAETIRHEVAHALATCSDADHH